MLGDVITAEGIAMTYKSYHQAYGRGSFMKFGLANIDVTDGVSNYEGPIPIILYGLESKEGSAIYGFEAGLGTTAGFGLLNLYAGVQF